MGLRIATNVPSVAVQKELSKASQKTDESYAKLSSGKRITKSADDAAGLGIAKKMEAEVRGRISAIIIESSCKFPSGVARTTRFL